MTKELSPSYSDHFFGFSKWTKNCLPYDVKDYSYLWLWMDGDCIFMNDTTREIHIIEIKCEDAKVKAYQHRILRKLEELGIFTHKLRLFYEPKYWGNHLILGDPRYAKKIILDEKEIAYEQLIKQLLEWHGMPNDLNIKDYLHPQANPGIIKIEEILEDKE